MRRIERRVFLSLLLPTISVIPSGCPSSSRLSSSPIPSSSAHVQSPRQPQLTHSLLKLFIEDESEQRWRHLNLRRQHLLLLLSTVAVCSDAASILAGYRGCRKSIRYHSFLRCYDPASASITVSLAASTATRYLAIFLPRSIVRKSSLPCK